MSDGLDQLPFSPSAEIAIKLLVVEMITISEQLRGLHRWLAKKKDYLQMNFSFVYWQTERIEEEKERKSVYIASV